MRAYFEKPRTTVGWKGLVNDPFLNDTFHIEEGIRIARRLLLRIAELGLPLSTEALDPISPQYLQELIAWSAIGARTTESQTHREMASGLSSAVGFKNGTDGSLDVAINALQSVSKPHRFLGINQAGQVSIIHTRGNGSAHVVLRGGHTGPNYDRDNIAQCERALAAAGLTSNIMIDCSHANSGKDPHRQLIGRTRRCCADRSRKSFDHRADDRKQHQRGESEAHEGSRSARVRSIGHRSMHRLADDGEPATRAGDGPQRRTEETTPFDFERRRGLAPDDRIEGRHW